MKTQALDEIIASLRKAEHHLEAEAAFCAHCASARATVGRVRRIFERAARIQKATHAP